MDKLTAELFEPSTLTVTEKFGPELDESRTEKG